MLWIRNILRVYSYVFEAVLCGMGLLLTVFALANSHVDVEVAWLPWSGPEEMQWIAGLALLGLVCVALALFGVLRWPLFVYSAGVVYVLVRGLFISTKYTFSGADEARGAAYLLLAAFVAFLGAFPMKRR